MVVKHHAACTATLLLFYQLSPVVIFGLLLYRGATHDPQCSRACPWTTGPQSGPTGVSLSLMQRSNHRPAPLQQKSNIASLWIPTQGPSMRSYSQLHRHHTSGALSEFLVQSSFGIVMARVYRASALKWPRCNVA